MEESEGFGFDEFSLEMEDFEYKQVKKFDRVFELGEGGSFCQKPCIYEGRVYVACLDRNVYCIDARTGELFWKFQAEGGFAPASPVAHQGTIYIGGYDFNFYALDARTGKLLWKFRTQGKICGNALVHENRVYFGSADYNLYCLDKDTGKLVWKFRTYAEVPSHPTVHKGMVLFGSYDRFLYCLDKNTGRLLWKLETQGDVYNEDPLLIHDDIVYFPSFDNMLRAADVNTGKLLWKFRTGTYGGMHSGPRMKDNVLYQVNREGVLHALTLEGKGLWQFRINNAMAIPYVHDDRVYVGTEDQNLYCISIDGKVLWKFKTQGAVWWRSVIWENKLYFTSADCHLYCVDARTHRLVWKFRGQGAPSHFPPPFESYELKVSKSAEDAGVKEGEERKSYELGALEEEGTSEYKTRITYQVSTQYASKGKYQVDSDEEEF